MKVSIKVKLVVVIILSFVVLSLTLAFFSYNKAKAFLEKRVEINLSSILFTTGKWIKEKFVILKKDLLTFSRSSTLKSNDMYLKSFFEDIEDQDLFFQGLREEILENRPKNNHDNKYKISYGQYKFYMYKLQNFAKDFINLKEFKNVLLVDAKSGYIYFELNPLDDFGTSLFKGKYRGSPIAQVFNRSRKLKNGEVLFSNFTHYSPYGKEVVAFIATPIYKEKKPDTICIFVIGEDTLKEILAHTKEGYQGLNVYVLIKNLDEITAIGSKGIFSKEKIDTSIIKKAFSEKSGMILGKKYATFYRPLKVFNEMWAVIGRVPIQSVNKDAEKLKWNIISISSIVILIFIVLLYLFISFIIYPIERLTDTITKITNKELPLDTNVEIKTGDEIGLLSKSFNKLLSLLREDLNAMNKFVTVLNGEAKNLEIIVKKEKEIVTTHATNITELATALEEFSNTMETITKVNEKALEGFKILKESAKESYYAQEKVTEGMNILKSEIENTFVIFDKVITMNKDIKGITDIIDNISDQIKIIAFNASLEAARAGDAGKGFSIIAAQIRELLESISRQNVEIKKIIEENSKNIGKISEKKEKMSYYLEIEEENIRSIDEFIEKVVELVERNEEFILSVFASQNEQKIAIKEYAISINEGKKRVEESKKIIEDIADSVTTLRELVNELIEMKENML